MLAHAWGAHERKMCEGYPAGHKLLRGTSQARGQQLGAWAGQDRGRSWVQMGADTKNRGTPGVRLATQQSHDLAQKTSRPHHVLVQVVSLVFGNFVKSIRFCPLGGEAVRWEARHQCAATQHSLYPRSHFPLISAPARLIAVAEIPVVTALPVS